MKKYQNNITIVSIFGTISILQFTVMYVIVNVNEFAFDTLIPTIIGITSIIVIAYLFKFKWKPRIEIVFEEKINDALYVIFNNLNRVDNDFDYHFKKINEYMGYEVVKKQESLVRGDPSSHLLTPVLSKLRKGDHTQEMMDYKNWLRLEKHIKEHALRKLKARHDEFNTDKIFDYLNTYIARTTFFAITNHIRVSYWFFDQINYNEVNWFYLDERKQYATQIIRYCEKHKIPKKGHDEGFLKFKQRWE